MAPLRHAISNSPFPISRICSNALTKPHVFSKTQGAITSARCVATSRRTTKALRVPPAPSATPASKYRQPSTPSIVFNPPPTAPTPYQTPSLFLPSTDPRRTILAQSYAYSNPYASSEQRLPPLAFPARQKTYHLTAEQIAEIRQLRAKDPFEWTKKKLAERFGCTEFFVAMCAPASKERMEWHRKKIEARESMWGPKRRKAREERRKRRELWARDA